MELRRSGFSEAEIRARENLLRQNSTASTATALKEHFILERIAEEEKIDVDEGDYEKEIFLIAAQSGESPRRVRAQLEKRGLMDVLRNQIIERKVLEAGAVGSQVQGRTVRAAKERHGSDLDGGRRRQRLRPSPSVTEEKRRSQGKVDMELGDGDKETRSVQSIATGSLSLPAPRLLVWTRLG